MGNHRIKQHPILPVPRKKEIMFEFNSQPMLAYEGEMIASALIANGIYVFGHHHKDGSAQGIFCANGQCAKCTVIADGVPVKSCMTEVKAGMIVKSLPTSQDRRDTHRSVDYRRRAFRAFCCYRAG